MLSTIDFTQFLSFAVPPNVDVLLTLETVQQDVPQTSIEVHLDSGNDFLKDVGLGRARSFWPCGFFRSAVGFQDIHDVWFSR
jgi:hypothetical protein